MLITQLNKAIDNAVNHIAEFDDNILEKLQKINNKLIKISIGKFILSKDYYIYINNSKIILSNDNKDLKPDLSIQVSIGGLIRAKLTSVEHALRQRDLEFTGDLNLAMDLQSIINNAAVDFLELFQDQLSKFTSDAFAWQFVNILRNILDKINIKNQEVTEQITDYLQIEKNILVNQYELEYFFKEIDKLSADVARLDARVDRFSEF